MSIIRLLAVILILSTLISCSSLLRRETPSIAHVHIGHSLTSWRDTPREAGLLIVAEQEAAMVLANADLAERSVREKRPDVDKYLENIARVIDPEISDTKDAKIYGLKKAAIGSISHLGYAAESPDASSNVLRTVSKTNLEAEEIVARIEELFEFVLAAREESDSEIVSTYIAEISRLSHDIIGGEGKSTEKIYGLSEYRQDIEMMVEREDPPYTTVDTWYLLNLVRLNDGRWAFRSGGPSSYGTGSDSGY